MNQGPCHAAIRSRTTYGRVCRSGLHSFAQWATIGIFSALLAVAPVFSQSGNSGATASTAAAQGPAQTPATPTPTAPPEPDKRRARNAFQSGRRAEQAADWKAAYAAYTEAAMYEPSNREYTILKEHARFQVVQLFVESAERQAITGDVAGARALLKQALDVDPNYVVARERLQELTPTPEETERQSGPRLAGLPRLILKPGTQAFDVRGTIRSAYDAIGNQFGVKMVFDGDLPDRAIHFEIPSVDFDTALQILALQTRTFTRVVDAHTMFVTQNTPEKVKDYTVEVEKQLLLPASVSTDEMNETVRMIREMTGIARTQLNTATRTLTVRSTEQNVALAEALINQIEQPHGEVMLEIDILELDNTLANQLGITPPTTSTLSMLSLPQIQQLEAAQNLGTLVQILQGIFGSSAVSSATGSALPALIAFGGGKTIFLATMPGAAANFSEAISSVHTARRVLLRAEDGKPATFFVGDRYPIDLGLLSASLSPTSTALLSGLQSGVSLPRTDYDVGKNPISVAIADFNKDGFPDLIVANQSDGTLSLLLGTGSGKFAAQTTISLPAGTAATSPSAVVTGDFNNDGNLDIAVTDMANSRVLVLLGNGDGTFQNAVAYATGSNPVALIAQDLDGDGQPDLAVVNQGDGKTASTVSVLLGNKVNGTQNGTFGTQVTYDVGVSPSAITAGTFVTSGFTSLAVTNKADNTVSVLLGQGTGSVENGTFAPQTTLATGKGPAGVTTGDFNGDGNTDLAVSNQTDGTVSILLGNGTGAFLAQTAYTAGSGPVGILAANFTGASPDIAVADETGNNIDVLIGNGDGTFTSPVSLATGNSPIALAGADVNGDGTIDLVSANNTSNSVTVTLNALPSNANGNPAASQIGYPSAEYEDLGLKVKATPRVHDDHEVTLQLQFDIKNLSGSSINGIPILSNRSVEQTVRLRENETSVLSGIVQTNELGTLSGWPFTSTAPGVGLLTGEETTNNQKTELLILVTPRALHLPSHDFPAVYAGRGEPSTPASAPLPPPVAPAAGPQPGAPGAPAPAQPPSFPAGRGGPFNPGYQPGQGPGTPLQPQPQPIQQPPNQQQQ